jgi:hypothetical protein
MLGKVLKKTAMALLQFTSSGNAWNLSDRSV